MILQKKKKQLYWKIHQQARKAKHFNMFKKQIKLLKIFKESKRTAILTSAGKWPFHWLKSSKTLQDQNPKTKNTTRTELKVVLHRREASQPEEKTGENWDGHGEEKVIVNMEDWKELWSENINPSFIKSLHWNNGKSGQIKNILANLHWLRISCTNLPLL